MLQFNKLLIHLDAYLPYLRLSLGARGRLYRRIALVKPRKKTRSRIDLALWVLATLSTSPGDVSDQ